jgi:hypothetical protein
LTLKQNPVCWIEPQPMQAFKIQIKSINGWSDLKCSDDDGQSEQYFVESFKTKEEAIEEMNSIIQALNDDPEGYRVVNWQVQEDFDLY